MDPPPNLSIDYLDLLPDEILLEILIKTDDLETLSGWCRTSKRINNICQDEVLWKRKYQKYFGLSGNTVLTGGVTWQEKYKQMVAPGINSPIAAGNYSYGIIDQNGNLYMAGDKQLLGIEPQPQMKHFSKEPHLVKFPQTVQGNNLISPKVVSISISTFIFEIAAAVTENGKAYIWGSPKSASSGFQKDTKIDFLPREIILPTKAVKIIVSSLGYIILLEDSSVYLNIGGDNRWNFKGLLRIKAVDVSIGFHLYAIITKNGEVHVGGIRIYNITSHDDNLTSSLKIPEPARSVIVLGDSVMVLSITGKVYRWNLRSTNGLQELANLMEPAKMIELPEPIVQLSERGGTYAALSETGKLYMWGYNNQNKISGDPKRRYLEPVEISFGLPNQLCFCWRKIYHRCYQ